MKSVIIVSPYFPPSTLAGVHRARHLAKHLPAAGWQPLVIAVHERHHTEPLDPGLAGLVPADVRVSKTGALPARLTRALGIGDIGIRAYVALRSALLEAIATERPAAVLITGAPFYPMLLAGEVRRRGVPVVLDFQDPWVSAWGAGQPPYSKAGIVHRLAERLEPIAVRSANAVVSVSEVQNAEMAARYPWLDRQSLFAIPIGGDPDDFASLRARCSAGGATVLGPGCLNFSYVGTMLPRSAPLLRCLLEAAAALRRSEPRLAARLRLNFVGTSNQPDGRANFRVRPLAEAKGVADLVQEIPQRLPFLEALNILTNSHALLLVGSDEPHYTASKIYPALMSGRPWLSLFHRASSAHAILSAAGGGLAHAFESPAELDALEGPLRESLRRLALSPESVGKADPSAYAPYEAREIARRFAQVFDMISRKPFNGAARSAMAAHQSTGAI
jgi:hypothetical protein